MPLDIEKVKGKIALLGVDFDELVAYIVGEANRGNSLVAPADVDAVTEKLKPVVAALIDAAEVQLANKIATAFDEIKSKIADLEGRIAASGGAPDIDALAMALGPYTVAIANKVATDVCQGMFKQVQSEIYKKMQEKYDSMLTGQGAPGDEPPSETAGVPATPRGGRPATGGGLVDLISALSVFAESPIGKIVVDRLLPSPAAALGDPQQKLKSAYELVKILRGLNLDESGSDKLIKTLTEPQPPAPPAKS